MIKDYDYQDRYKEKEIKVSPLPFYNQEKGDTGSSLRPVFLSLI